MASVHSEDLDAGGGEDGDSGVGGDFVDQKVDDGVPFSDEDIVGLTAGEVFDGEVFGPDEGMVAPVETVLGVAAGGTGFHLSLEAAPVDAVEEAVVADAIGCGVDDDIVCVGEVFGGPASLAGLDGVRV